MKSTDLVFLLVGMAILTACTISKPEAIVVSNIQECPPNEICETALSQDISATTTAAIIATPAPGSRYYYVSTGGNDADSGTRDKPFKSISKAANAATAGDVVLIHAGVYLEDVKPLHSGKPDKYITYQNEGDGEVIIDAQDGQRAVCIEIDNKSYLQFIGLTVRGANSYGTWPRAGIAMTDGAHHIILDTITAYNNYVGIMAYGRKTPVGFITVKNSKTFESGGNFGNTHYGIFFYKKVYDSSIVNNHVAYTLPETQSYGIEISTNYPGAQADGPRRIVIAGNEVDHSESQGIHTWNAVGVLISNNFLHDNGATGIQVEDGSENIVVENNLSENNAQQYEFEAGAWVDHAKNVVVRNNILRRNKVGLTITTSDRVVVHGNYLYLNNRGAQNLYNAAGLIVDHAVTNISITQNTFYKNGASGMERGAVNFGIFHPSCANITFINNIVSETTSTVDLVQDACSGFVSDFNAFYNSRHLAFQWNQSQFDWPGYLAASGQDAHSQTSAPLFMDPSTFNFSLQPASPLIGKGMILARTTGAGTGKTVTVTDASFFSDGFGIGSGDSIMIDSNRVNIVSIDYTNHSITVDQEITWGENNAVSFPFTGDAPDIGASSTP